MNISSPLPTPTTEERVLSDQLVQQIIKEIQQTTQQSIPFRRFMEMALYQPNLGYYVAGKHKLGHQGDFTTAPELSPLYSRCIAQQCQPILEQLNIADILEFGAGSGAMAAEILSYLDEQKILPQYYLILEVSPDLTAQQKQHLAKKIPHLMSRIQWITALPEDFKGVILANEVLDAMPVDLFSIINEEVYQQHIQFDGEQLVTCDQLASQSFANTISTLNIKPHNKHSHYTSEINPMIAPWIHAIAEKLTQGIILLIDYGYTRQEYYHPDRNIGTLLCYYQHRAHGDFLYHPGLQDITANVDFTAVAEAADNAGLDVLGFTPQATFLIANGLENHLMYALENTPDKQYQLAQQVRTLTLPAEMGEHFKVITLGRNINEGLLGFTSVDSRHKL